MACAAVAADEEERRLFHEEWKARKMAREEEEVKKKLGDRRAELTEHEAERWAVECRNVQKKRRGNVGGRRKVAEKEEEEQKVAKPSCFEEEIREAAMTEQARSPVAIIEMAGQDVCDTAVPKPTSWTDTQPAAAQTVVTVTTSSKENSIPPPHPNDPTTALTSNPASSSECAFARDLSNAHHARLIVAEASREKQQNVLVAFDAATGYGKASKTMKLTFSKAVIKGFNEIFGEERCW